nr:Yip1 family protein [Limosilactobacillus mucosae]
MIFLGWIFILWAAYLLLNHRHNIKDSKKLIVGIVSLVFLGVVMFAVGNSNSHSSTKQQTSSKVVKKHHSERKQKKTSSNSSSESKASSESSSNDDYDNSSVSSSNNSISSTDSSVASENDSESSTTSPSNKGDLMTDQQGTIVGNSKTMIYHTPEQAGYRMNSANAVYFNSEAEAQAAGYRKALR